MSQASSPTTILKQIEIDAPAAAVWRVFVDPTVTRRLGGAYVSGWQVGSSFGWQGADGRTLTRGRIRRIEAERLLEHDLFDPEPPHGSLSVITYTLEERDGHTTLTAQEELLRRPTAQEHADMSAGWDAALAGIKELFRG